MKKTLNALQIFSLLILSILSPLGFCQITSEIYPKSGGINDLYTLSFTIDGNKQNALPDFSPLDKNFDIESTNSSTQISVVNGQMSAQMKWTVTLSPRKPGTFTIPAIHFGNEKSKPITLTINDQGTKTKIPKDKNAFIKNEVDNKTPFVQSEVLYTIKLYFAKRLSGADFIEPQAENAVLMQLGEAKNHQTSINGKRYFILEQHYAVFPEKSGNIKISPPVFKGIIERDQLSRIDQILMDVQKPIRLQGNEITLSVKAKPHNYPYKTWLPAKDLTLSEDFDNRNEPIEVGKPITRTVTIKALGLTASQLPNIVARDSKDFKAYPEKPTQDNRIKDSSVQAEKTIKIVYLPLQEGDIKLPEISIPWWNVKTNKIEKATLPATTVKVINPTPKANTNSNTPSKKSTTPPIEKSSKLSYSTLTPWALVALLLFSWLIFFINKCFPLNTLFCRHKKRANKTFTTNVKSEFRAACLKNDAKNAFNFLLPYLNQKEKRLTFMTLQEAINFYQNNEFESCVSHLQTTLYAKQKCTWAGRELWQISKKLHKKKSPISRDKTLPPLNP